jgi:hypothetical protein
MGSSFMLTTVEDIGGHVANGATLASPDWDRVGVELKEALSGSAVELIEEKRAPQARVVGELVHGNIGKDISSREGPLTPIYMHPPVFVKPGSFPKA